MFRQSGQRPISFRPTTWLKEQLEQRTDQPMLRGKGIGTVALRDLERIFYLLDFAEMREVQEIPTSEQDKSEEPIAFRPYEQMYHRIIEQAESRQCKPGAYVNDILSIYYAAIHLATPTFTQEEAMILANATNGLIITPQTAHLLWAQVEDTLIDLQIETDGEPTINEPFIKRLRSLSRFECMAVCDALERAWNSETYHVEDMAARLQAVGLVRKEGVHHA